MELHLELKYLDRQEIVELHKSLSNRERGIDLEPPKADWQGTGTQRELDAARMLLIGAESKLKGRGRPRSQTS